MEPACSSCLAHMRPHKVTMLIECLIGSQWDWQLGMQVVHALVVDQVLRGKVVACVSFLAAILCC